MLGKMGFNIIENIKSAIQAAAELGSKADNFNTRSVARGANEQSFQFPAYVDSTIPVDLAVTTVRNLDRLYASWTQIYLSSIGFIDLNYIRNPRQFIAKYQPKYRLESGDEDPDVSYLEEGYDDSLRDLYGPDESFYSESVGEDGHVSALFTPSNRRASADLMRQQREGMRPYLDGVNANRLAPYQEATGDVDKLFDDLLANTAQNEIDRRNNEQLRSQKDSRAPRLSEADCKKANDMQPYMIDLKLLAGRGDSSFSQWINYTIGVKTTMHLAETRVLEKNIVYLLQNKNHTFNFIRWTTGEVSLLKDIILHLDDINFDVANKNDPTGKFIASMRRLKKKGIKVGTYGANRTAPFATIVISSSTYRSIRDNWGYDLKNLTFGHKIMEELFLMCFVIIDDVNHTVDMLVDGQADYQTYSLDMLEREVTMNSNKLGKELTRMLGSGM
jgi:hypothetical protein